MSQSSLFESPGRRPLADRLRPSTLDEFAGQTHLVGEGRPLRDAILRGDVGNVILWGPPGTGKTTLAWIIAQLTNKQFEPFSAVTEGVARVRQIIKEAEARLVREGRGTILFCDEIHRFNKAQQDAFLPWVENGTIALIGATTENPSFELTSALLSRCQVHVLEPLGSDDLRVICERCAESCEREIEEEAMDALIRWADGDARRAINVLETAFEMPGTGDGGPGTDSETPLTAHRLPLTVEDVEAVLSRRVPRYDKGGEEHYNVVSALHKAVRGSDVEGALYWLARMIAGGEDPLYVARRLVRMATEDVGLADPRALSVTLAAKEAYHFLGSPEGELALAEAAVYLATAPKSNRVYAAWAAARRAADEHPAERVPLHIRNAPTKLMKDLGYGEAYRYDHSEPDGKAVGQTYLPESLAGVKWYDPSDVGYEKTVGERIAWWERMKDAAS